MPLEVLGPLVAVGIGGVVLLVHLLGWSRPRALADEAEAVAALTREFPDAAARRVILGDDRIAALVELKRGLGVVRAMGIGRVARALGPGEAEARTRRGGIRIVMADFGAPNLDIALADADQRAEALAMARRALGEDA
jgi:hypothetical protein